MKRLVISLIIALSLALACSLQWQDNDFEQRLTAIRFAALPGTTPALKQQPTDIQALLLGYADDPVLLLQTQASLLASPELAPRLLRLYGDNPLFQEAMTHYGSSILPPIDYFLTHEITTLEIMRKANTTWEQLKQTWNRLFQDDSDAPMEIASSNEPLTPLQRGEFALGFINTEGHRFLAQFIVDRQGKVHWITTQRIVAGAGDLLAGGIRTLETKQKQGQTTRFSDYGWASLDLLVMAAPVWGIARLGAATKATEAGVRTARPVRTGKLSATLKASSSKTLRLVRKHPLKSAFAAATLLALHPSLLNALLDTLAQWIGWSPVLLKSVIWTLLWLPLVYTGLWLIGALTRRRATMPPAQPGD